MNPFKGVILVSGLLIERQCIIGFSERYPVVTGVIPNCHVVELVVKNCACKGLWSNCGVNKIYQCISPWLASRVVIDSAE